MADARQLVEGFERLPSGIRTALDDDRREAEYDRIAGVYDRVVGNGIYNRLVWGCPKSAYHEAAQVFFERARQAPVIDFGCGSLVFTAAAYRGHERDMVLFDRSLGMLERGQRRLCEGHFLQGDALDPPFEDASFNGAMSWGMLHLFGTGSAYLARLRNLVQPGAIVAVGTLVLADRKLGDAWLRGLHKRGEAAKPQTRHAVVKGFERYFDLENVEEHGNMLFLFGHRRYR